MQDPKKYAWSFFVFVSAALNFEDTAADTCKANLLNVEFNNLMPYNTAFGLKNEIDILEASCLVDTAYSGDFFIALFAFECNCEIYYPTAFSPNYEGINDDWSPNELILNLF